MALVKRKNPEQRDADLQVKAEQRRLEQIEKARRAFFASPAGRARVAFDKGDQVFQCSYDVMSQQAIVVAMVGSRTSKKTSDPTDILNSVCHEGWELVNGSFVFVEQGQQSRDKLMSSGQNVAINGMTVGYYLFKRCEANRQDTTKPWEHLDESDDENSFFTCSECGAEIASDAPTCPTCGAEFEDSTEPV